MKKILSLLFMLVMVVSLVPAAIAAETDSVIRVAFTNDIHGHIAQSGADIGMAKFIAKVKDLEVDMVLDAGDLYHGSAVATLTNGESVADIIKSTGMFAAMTVGNHDWNYGREQLLKLEERSEMPILASNVIVTATGEQFFGEDTTLIKEINGVKVGIFGVVDPGVYDSTARALMNGLGYADPIEYAKEDVAFLQSEGCGIIIGLTHTTDRKDIAENVPGVDIVITGHEHIIADETINGVRVVQTGTALQNLCYMEIVFDNNAKEIKSAVVTRMTAQDLVDVEPNAVVQAAMDEINERIQPVLQTVIGTTPVDLIAEKITVRSNETNMTRVVTDAFCYVTGADIAFENSGGVRDAAIKAGDITYGDAITTSPFGNYLLTKTLSGLDIYSIIVHSYDEFFWKTQEALLKNDQSLWPESDGSGLHVSGLTYCYDRSRPEGERVWDIKVNGEPLDYGKDYVVAMSNFVADLADFSEIVAAEVNEVFMGTDEAIIKYISEKGVEDSVYDSMRMEEKAWEDTEESPAPTTDPMQPSTETPDIPNTGDKYVVLPLVLAAAAVAMMIIVMRRKNNGEV